MISPVKIWRRQKEVGEILNKKGTVVSWTKIYTPPVGFKNNAPYYVVLVDFGKQGRAVGQLVDTGETQVKTGMRVVSILRKVREVDHDDVIAYGMKFKPQ